MGFIPDFDWKFMTALKHGSCTDGGTQRCTFPPETGHMTPSCPGWLLILYVLPLQSIRKLSSVSIQTYCLMFKNGCSEIIFKDTKVFNTYISNLIIAYFSWRAPGLLGWLTSSLDYFAQKPREKHYQFFKLLICKAFFLISHGISL